MYELNSAAAAFYGPYDNGVSRKRFTVQEVLDGKPHEGSEGKIFEAKAVLAGLQSVIAAAPTRQEVSETGGKWDWDILLATRAAAKEALEDTGMSENIVGRLALSEVDPKSLRFPITAEDVLLAEIVIASRDVARRITNMDRRIADD